MAAGGSISRLEKEVLSPAPVQGVPQLKEESEPGIYVQKGQLFESTD